MLGQQLSNLPTHKINHIKKYDSMISQVSTASYSIVPKYDMYSEHIYIYMDRLVCIIITHNSLSRYHSISICIYIYICHRCMYFHCQKGHWMLCLAFWDGWEGSLSGGGCGVFQSLHFAKPVIDLYATVACISTARRVTECSASRFASTGDWSASLES